MNENLIEELKSHAPESPAVKLGTAFHQVAEEALKSDPYALLGGEPITQQEAEERVAKLKAELDAKGVEYVIIDESKADAINGDTLSDADKKALAQAKAIILDIQGRNAEQRKLEVMSRIKSIGFKRTVATAFGRRFGSGKNLAAAIRMQPPKVTQEKPSALVKMGKYAPCACGSGKKFKFCCGSK